MKCFEHLGVQIDELDFLTTQNKTYKIQKYFGGDLKILALMCGINYANSNFPCIWCKYDKRELFESKKEYSITDPNKYARTLEEAKNSQNKFGYINLPILNSLPFQFYIIGTLHMMLRITDVLMDLFLIDLQTLDGHIKNPIDMEADTYANRFFQDIEVNLKLRIYSIDEKKKIVSIKSLMGPDK